MKRASVVVALALVTSFSITGTSHAQWRSYIGGLHFGYATSTDDGGPSGSVGGTLAGYTMRSEVLGAGFEVGYHYLGKTSGASAIGQGLWQTTANFRAQSNSAKLQPYFVGGLGVYWVNTSIGDPTITSTTVGRFGFNLGGGIALPLKGKNVQLAVDGRWHEVVDGNPGGTELDAVTIYGGILFTR